MSMPMLLTRREAVVALAGVALIVACGHSPVDQPVAIAYGRDECAWCRMTVDDPALAAEWLDPNASPLIFGEPGCLLSWLAAHQGALGTAWVRTREGDQWLRATEAAFAQGIVTTPMAFNLTAHRVAPAAGVTSTWAQLLVKGAPNARPS